MTIEFDESVILYCAGIKYSPCKKDFDVEVAGSGAISITCSHCGTTGQMKF